MVYADVHNHQAIGIALPENLDARLRSLGDVTIGYMRWREYFGSGKRKLTGRWWVATELLPLFAIISLPAILDFAWWIEALILVAAAVGLSIFSALVLPNAPEQASSDDVALLEENQEVLDFGSRLQWYVQVLAPLLTIVMFTIILVSQQAWVEGLERPRWVDAATGVAVLGWLAGTVLVTLGIPRSPWILSAASISGLLAQWGDTLGGEVGFDLTFYAVQGSAIAVHFILVTSLALVPAVEDPVDPVAAVPVG